MDYPYNLKGILYFPKINMEYESAEGTIKLYNNQVFVADNIKEVIPEYLMLLKGVIDCPDLPLNVSRSQLQNDGFVKKIQDYITKKVADKLSGLCKTDRENYEKYWDDIAPFIKYGCLRDDKFCKKMTDYILFKDINGKFLALPECLEVEKSDVDEATEKDGAENSAANEATASTEDTAKTAENSDKPEKNKVIYYVTDPVQQSQYIAMFKNAGKDAVILPERIDQPFISELEAKNQGVHFRRIDADLSEEFKAAVSADEQKTLDEQQKDLETEIRAAAKKDKLTVKLQKLTQSSIAAMLSISEESRRMNDMMKMYAMSGMPMSDMPVDETLILNTEHPLVQYLIEHRTDEAAKETVDMISEQLYDLAKLQQSPLSADEMTKFISRSNEILLKMAK